MDDSNISAGAAPDRWEREFDLYRETGRPEHLDVAIDALQNAARYSVSATEAVRTQCMLAGLLIERYRRFRQTPGDVRDAMGALKQAFANGALVPDDHAQIALLFAVGAHLCTADLGEGWRVREASTHLRAALARVDLLTPATRARLRHALGQALVSMFDAGADNEELRDRDATRSGGMLDSAVTELRAAICDEYLPAQELSPARHALAHALLSSFMREARVQVLPEMLALQRQAAASAPRGEIIPSVNLAGVLRLHWEVYSQPDRLDEAVQVLETAIREHAAASVSNADASQHPDLAWAKGVLGLLKRDLYLRERRVSLIHESIRLYRSALAASRLGPMQRQVLGGYLAVALLHRGTSADLDEAVMIQSSILQNANQVGGQRNIWRSNLAAMLRRRNGAGDLENAIELYRLAMRETGAEHYAIGSFVVNLAHALSQRFADSGDLADLDEAQHSLADALRVDDGTVQRARVAFELADVSLRGQAWQMAVWAAQTGIARVEAAAGAFGGPTWREWLANIQGLASMGAFAAAKLGDVRGAAALIERGCAVLSAARLSQQATTLARARALGHGRLVSRYVAAAERLEHFIGAVSTVGHEDSSLNPGLSYVEPAGIRAALSEFAAARASLESRAGSIAPASSVSQLAVLTTTTQSDIAYIVTTPVGGMSLRVGPSDTTSVDVNVQWLPHLTRSAVLTWVELVFDTASQGSVAQAVRGVMDAPNPGSVAQAIDQMSGVLAPARKPSSTRAVRLVPVGTLALLPITAAWPDQVPTSVAASGQLHVTAAANTTRRPNQNKIIAVTDPRPCTWLDRGTAALKGAREEGEYLAKRHGAVHYTMSRATATAVRDALVDDKCCVLHVGAHGATPPDDPDTPSLLLANNDHGLAETITPDDLRNGTVACALIFLACCWLARSSRHLPDEAIGFPTHIVQAGAGAVVAPLWPVSDRATSLLVCTFYEEHLTHRQPPAQALLAARHAVLARADTLRAAEAELWRATANAFVVTGA